METDSAETKAYFKKSNPQRGKKGASMKHEQNVKTRTKKLEIQKKTLGN